jgi:hypothetical protein
MGGGSALANRQGAGPSRVSGSFARHAPTIAMGIAQATPPRGPAPTPCVSAAERHQFDFWVGEWDVFDLAGAKVGTSSVQVVSGGCALLENWTAGNALQGKSLNAYNAARSQWQQYWFGQDGTVTEYRESAWVGKALQFTAHADATTAAPATILHLTFTPLDDGSVRQLGQLSSDGGATWKTTYDFRYRCR